MTHHTPTAPRPRAAEHVSYVVQAGRVDALYIPDPTADPREVLATILDRKRWPDVEWIATLVRDGRRWIVEGSDHDPFPDSNNGVGTRREGMVGLRRAVAEHLAAGPGRCPICQDGPADPHGAPDPVTEEMDDALVDAVAAAERQGWPATLASYVAPQVRQALDAQRLVAYRHFGQAYALTSAGTERGERVLAERRKHSRAASSTTCWAYDTDHARDDDVAQAAQALAGAGHRPVRLTRVGDGPWTVWGEGYRVHRLDAEHVRVAHYRDGVEAEAPDRMAEWARALWQGFDVVRVTGGTVDARRRR
jgi:hypothetical protein